jgi:hypothetical protein
MYLSCFHKLLVAARGLPRAAASELAVMEGAMWRSPPCCYHHEAAGITTLLPLLHRQVKYTNKFPCFVFLHVEFVKKPDKLAYVSHRKKKSVL